MYLSYAKRNGRQLGLVHPHVSIKRRLLRHAARPLHLQQQVVARTTLAWHLTLDEIYGTGYGLVLQDPMLFYRHCVNVVIAGVGKKNGNL